MATKKSTRTTRTDPELLSLLAAFRQMSEPVQVKFLRYVRAVMRDDSILQRIKAAGLTHGPGYLDAALQIIDEIPGGRVQ